MSDAEKLRRDFERAGVLLAVVVSVQHRIATEPDYAADRTPAADRMRAQHLQERLAEFQSAQKAMEEG